MFLCDCFYSSSVGFQGREERGMELRACVAVPKRAESPKINALFRAKLPELSTG